MMKAATQAMTKLSKDTMSKWATVAMTSRKMNIRTKMKRRKKRKMMTMRRKTKSN